MKKAEDPDQVIESICETHASLADHFRDRPRETIRPLRPELQNALGQTLRLLGERRQGISDRGSATLKLGDTLGRGGMGIVRSAVQVSLGRAVAVKTLQPQFRGAKTTLMLLQEAWVTGNLEHPNIMPVYDIELDGEGMPLVVLKRIEGVHWGELMFDAERIRERFGDDNPLQWNLRILQEVCNAMHFAHSRGIIHRDLKPENVMIGEFGEVYVVDWGLAVSLRDDCSGRLPLASEARELAGTPNYMAPEILDERDPRLSERTDIYLLGAILFEIMAGHPPHRGATQAQIIASILHSSPALPADAPQELRRICQRAMHPDPAQRYQTADQLRLALHGFIQHIGSTRLESRAQRHLNQLLEDLRRRPPDEVGHRQHLYNVFRECRFGFSQAIELWPDNEAAMEGVRRSTEAMIEYELQSGDVRSASSLMAELHQTSPALQQRLREALEAEQQKQQHIRKLEQLGEQLDVRVGQRERAIWAAVLGLLWTLSPLLIPLGIRHLRIGNHVPYIVILSGILLFLGVLRWLGRENVTRSIITRRLLAAAFAAISSTIILNLVGMILGLSPELVLVFWPFCWFCVTVMLVITVDLRLAPMAGGFLAALFVSAVRPELSPYAMIASNLLATVNMFYIWAPQRWEP